jgi:hypothetical protein
MARFPFNFKRQFAAAVADGTKRQTIRANRKDGKRPQPGDIAALYTGLRTRNTQHLRDGVVINCHAVRIDCVGGHGKLIIDGDVLSWEARTGFAKADGFADWPAMLDFFRTQYGLDTFDGFCVEWAV